MEHSHFTEGQRNELKKLMTEAIDEYFSSKNQLVRNWIVEIAKLAIALTAIGVFIKTVLGWFGYAKVGTLISSKAVTFMK